MEEPAIIRADGAEIEVRSVFNVKGRGAVVIGYLRRGAARVGQRTQPPVPGAGTDRSLTLAAVQVMHSSEGGANALGLVFEERPSLEELIARFAPGTVLRFVDAGTQVTGR